jgi:hypothetical protein
VRRRRKRKQLRDISGYNSPPPKNLKTELFISQKKYRKNAVLSNCKKYPSFQAFLVS